MNKRARSPAAAGATLAALSVLALAASPLAAQAQTLKPGLWEITNMIRGGGPSTQDAARVQQELANLPPEQRQMIQDMMAKHGLTMGSAGPGGLSVRACMTKEMVERNEVPAQQGECRHNTAPRIGNSMKLSFSCTNPPASGEGTITFLSPESYSMRMAVNTTAAGRSENIEMDATGKWLAADCGAVKPMTAPRR